MRRFSFGGSFILLIFLFSGSFSVFAAIPREKPNETEINRLLQNIPPAENYPDAAVLYGLKEKIVEVSKDARSKETRHVIFKVIKDRGKGQTDIQIDFNSRFESASIVFARTITPQRVIIPLKGEAVKIITPFQRFPAYNDCKQLNFSMPGVTVGSVIEYEVVIEKKIPPIEGKFSDLFSFQEFEPVSLSRYQITIPTEINLNYLFLNPPQNIQLPPRFTPQAGKKTFAWEYRNIPQLQPEDHMPPFDEVTFQIMVTNFSSWGEFSSWWKRKIKGKIEPNRAIKEKVGELTQSLSKPEEKIEALYDYVKREVRSVTVNFGKAGYEPEPAVEVFENLYGDSKDKSTLLISMLRLAGIQAYYALIPTHAMKNLKTNFPFPFQINHCLVAVEKGKEYLFLDPLAAAHPMNYLPVVDQNRDAIIFKDQGITFSKTPLAKPQENAAYRQHRIHLDADGSMEDQVKNSGSGETEASLRLLFIDYSPRETRQLIEKRLDRSFSGATLVAYSYSDPHNFKSPFTCEITYRSPDFCQRMGEILIFALPRLQTGCQAVGTKERIYPIELWGLSVRKEDVEFNIPEGYDLYFLPGEVEILTPFFEFRSNYQRKNGKIFYQGEFIEKDLMIQAEEYPEYQKFCQTIEKSYKRVVLFRKKNP